MSSEQQQIVSDADSFARNGSYQQALELYFSVVNEAYNSNNPFDDYTSWVCLAALDAAVKARFFDDVRAAFLEVVAPKATKFLVGNPLFHLRWGQIQFEVGSKEKAVDDLMRALWGGGPRIFAGEDPKYLKFLKKRVIPPPGLKWSEVNPEDESSLGICVDKLNGCHGRVREVIEAKLGPGPYVVEVDDDDDNNDIDDEDDDIEGCNV
eukprot:TRINITY_DN9705_c0_g1_i3.p1 TRINITY_DN9705_c0_g1~~TRINITY_DN9705_c0_g1_i3.p1  ORF type:complete len:227 (-),score=51.06 TRINITY_DN9705_c0_g1_i3:265-888(-)